MTTIDRSVQEGSAPVGAANAPHVPSTALLVLTGGGEPPAPRVLEGVGRAVAAARADRVPVIWVAVGRGAPATLGPVDGPPFGPVPGETTQHVDGASAFAGGALDGVLRASRIDRVALAGYPLRDAVLSTAVAADELGYRVTVLADAVGDPEPDVESVLLERLVPRYGHVLDVDGWAETIRPQRSPWLTRRVGRGPARVSPLFLGAAIAVVVIIIGGYLYLRHQAQGFYSEAPGSAPLITGRADCQPRPAGSEDLSLPNGSPCVRLVVPGRAADLSGSLFMVDVLLGPASTFDYTLDQLGILKTFHDGMQLVPAAAILGTTPAAQLNCQEVQQMSGAQDAASVVALRQVGDQVLEHDLGALIEQVVPGSAAATAGLQVNDRITAFAGQPVGTTSQLATLIHAQKPGARVQVTVQRPSGRQCALRPVTVTDTLGATPGHAAVAFLGVGTVTDATYKLPIAVSVNVGNIGGPSAGLALTLGLIDELSTGQLTGGHKVAATGTMDPSGNVGDVGGVAQKTVAVRNAGAQLFLVPPQEYQVARSEAGTHMKVEAVSNIQQALADLKALGGQVPAPPPSTSPTNPGGG